VFFINEAVFLTERIGTSSRFASIKKLKGGTPEHPVYTFRIGFYYRAILSVHDNVLIIQVLEIEDRDQA
jgi:hypothetical protein